MWKITKKFRLAASHRLYSNKMSGDENRKVYGKCANYPSHGHTFCVEVTLISDKLKHGMVRNFSEIKKIFNEKITERFDHAFWNNTIMFVPTAENMAKYFYKILKPTIPELYSITIHENEGEAWVEYFEKNNNGGK